jgi:hypothetical protein
MLHEVLVRPIVELFVRFLSVLEAAALTVTDEAFQRTYRAINGLSVWTLSLLGSHPDYRRQVRQNWRGGEAWREWWRQERPSTLNAVVARYGGEGSGGVGEL